MDRILYTVGDIDTLATFLRTRKLPLTVTWQSGKHRSTEQNRLQRMWCKEASEQLGDVTAEEVRGFCKLTIGVPLLRHVDDVFCTEYDELIRPLPYEHKMRLMMEPFDFAVTRRMKVREKVQYLDLMNQHYAEQGVQLTQPSDDFQKYAARYREKEPAA